MRATRAPSGASGAAAAERRAALVVSKAEWPRRVWRPRAPQEPVALTDHEPDPPASPKPRARPRTLSEHAADSTARPGAPDTADRAVCPPDLRPGPREAQSDHPRHPAAHRRRRGF